MVVKRMVVQRLIRWFSLAACFLSAPCLPAVARASPAPSDSVFQCVVLDHEAWLREDGPVAGKRTADKNVGEPGTVRMIYLMPNDREYRQAVVDSMKATMIRVQTYFGQQMEAHGYGYRTFRYETGADGEPVVHRVVGEHADPYGYTTAAREIYRVFESNYHVYFVVIDNSIDRIHLGGDNWASGLGAGSKNQGIMYVTSNFPFGLVIHEMVHAFGVGWHGFFGDRAIGTNHSELSACTVGYLSVHPFFNPEIPLEDDWTSDPTVEFIGPTSWYPVGTDRFTLPLRVVDPDGVHQVILLSANPVGTSLAPEFMACRMLAGETEAVVTFEYDGVIPSLANSSFSDPPSHKFQAVAVDRRAEVGDRIFGIALASPHHLGTLVPQTDVGGVFDAVAFSPDGGILAAGRNDNTVRLWDVASWREMSALEGLYGVGSVAFSPDGAILAAGGYFGPVRLWDTESWDEIVTLEAHTRRVNSLSFSPDAGVLASASSDSTVKLWDTETWEEIATVQVAGRVAAFSPDGGILASGAADGTVKLWDVATWREIATLEGQNKVRKLAFSPDGRLLASVELFNGVMLWDVGSRRKIATVDAPYTRSIPFSPDGGILAVVIRRKGTVALWDVFSEEIVDEYAHQFSVRSLAFSPDGGILAAATYYAIQLWDVSPHTGPASRIPDWDGDGAVGFGDFVKFAAKFGFSRGQIGYDPRFDLDRDGNVGFNDFLIFANAFGKKTSST